jgi:pimeloyl-ACP methyl ester carboxylesterase
MVRNAEPIILIHGWSDKSGETFDQLPLLLETLLERPVRFFHYETSNVNNAPRVDQSYQELGIGEEKDSLAVQLRDFLESPENRSREIDRCDIIAHSMGGLVARNFVLVEPEKKVRRLITIGTPSYGGLFADSFVGDLVLNNQAEDLEYGCELTWKLHQEWALLANRERLPDTLTIVGTDDFGFGEYNQGDGVVTCSSASLESLGSLVYYVPGKHSEAFGPLGATAIARVESPAHPSWDLIKDFLTSEQPSLASGLPGHNGNADDVGHKDHPDPLPSGALYLAKFAAQGSLIPLDEDDVELGHNEPFLGINTSGAHESSGIYFANLLTADGSSVGSRHYTDAPATVQGQQTEPIRIFAGHTRVFIIGRDSPEYRFGDLDGDHLPDEFEEFLINGDQGDSITSHLQVRPQDDPDGDGLANLLEAALGTNPLEQELGALEILSHDNQILVRYPEPVNTGSIRRSKSTMRNRHLGRQLRSPVHRWMGKSSMPSGGTRRRPSIVSLRNPERITDRV